MRLLYAQELVLAVGVGLGLASYRLTWPDRSSTFGPTSGIDWFEVGIDATFAGIGLVGGLATFCERARRSSRGPWGPGRWVWSLVASYFLLTLLDQILGTIAMRFAPGVVFLQKSITTDIIDGIRGRYGAFLFPFMTWFLLSLGLTWLAVRAPRDPAPDAREWCGRVFGALVVSTGLGLRVFELLGFRSQIMGGSG
jgi:hypothetical protein